MNSIGIEITKEEVLVALVKNEKKAEVIKCTPIPLLKTLDETLSATADLAKELIAEASLSLEDIASVGIAIGAPVFGTIVRKSVFGDEVDLAGIKKYLPINDLKVIKTENALAIAEEHLTYGSGYSIGYVTLNDEIGFGLLIGGKPYVGANGLAADVAHTTVQRGGKTCSCGNQGCFEAYASLAAFEEGDRDEYVSYLACGITNVMNLFQPNVIVIGGKVMEIGGEALLSDIGTIIHKENYARNSVNKTLLALPSVDNFAAVIGAAIA